MASNDSKVWFVTGASSGLGRAVVEYTLARGESVVATLRKPQALDDLVSKYPATQLLVLPLDVISPPAITAAFSAAIAKFGRIDVVYNNAGFAEIAEVEGTPDADARYVFEVNFWGATNVSREAVRVFRDVNAPRGGRLLQVSSVVGLKATPGMGFYSSTKHALEGISQALASELDPAWGISITLLEPGLFGTRAIVTDGGMHAHPVHPSYTAPGLPAAAMREFLAGPGREVGGNPDKAARAIYEIARTEGVGQRVPLGLDAIAGIEAQLEAIRKDLEEARKWSVDLK
ncbi:hypothetical protein HYPSUDRAFT_220327 [Hypholoma sublateritium FD-334 SS-4]|uniref:NAD(P)-binding protein n=1 Tax=Hypholoma sublateritium (strain FD-334 SS-4) TaxID=945553 RepID=A0A0D2LVD3_HYPSF|nr:hypothetical protein HYPSUDRAFT_220327 [Hypholoma sublateritium FD-334 SS-4]